MQLNEKQETFYKWKMLVRGRLASGGTRGATRQILTKVGARNPSAALFACN